MSFQDLIDLVYTAMQPTFTVFGFEINLWGFFVFSVVMSVVAFFIRNFFSGGDD